MEPILAAKVGALRSHPLVEEVRVAGLLAGVELDAEARAQDPRLVERVVVGARERGVLVRNLVAATLQISPPLVVDEEQLTLLGDTLGEVLEEVSV
jgi:4-aminobutyrate--pyruvate transaminase